MKIAPQQTNSLPVRFFRIFRDTAIALIVLLALGKHRKTLYIY